MADFNGLRMADVLANPPLMIDSAFHGGLEVFTDELATVVATHVAGSRILVARLPKGAVPLKFEFVSSVANTATLDWGDGTTVDKFVDGMDPNNAETVYVGANQVDGAIGKKLAAETTIYVTVLGAALATGTVVFRSYYMLVA